VAKLLFKCKRVCMNVCVGVFHILCALYESVFMPKSFGMPRIHSILVASLCQRHCLQRFSGTVRIFAKFHRILSCGSENGREWKNSSKIEVGGKWQIRQKTSTWASSAFGIWITWLDSTRLNSTSRLLVLLNF